MARLWHAPAIARWKLERGARQLTDRAAISQPTYKHDEWLLSEVLADRGESVVVEPASMRAVVAKRAKALETELGARHEAQARGSTNLSLAPLAAPGRLERPPVRLGDLPRQPETVAARARSADAAREHVEPRWDPGAVVGHLDDDRPRLRARRHDDPVPWRSPLATTFASA